MPALCAASRCSAVWEAAIVRPLKEWSCRFGEKGLALAQWSFLLDSPQIAHIYGTKGEIDMERVHCPEHLRVTYSTGEQKVRACQTDLNHRQG